VLQGRRITTGTVGALLLADGHIPGVPSVLKAFLRGVVRSRPVRHFSAWLDESHASGGAMRATDSNPTGPAAQFIHIPKTGGTFVAQAENGGHGIIFPMRPLGHATLVDRDWELFWDVPAPFGEAQAIPLSEVDQQIVFSNVRNIFSFLVSYLHHAAGRVARYRNEHHYDFSIANRGFDYLVKSISDRELIWPSRKFVHYQLFSQPSGISVVDWINCTATLDRDLRDMAQYFAIGYRAGKPQREGPRADYRSYYSDALVDLVSETWRREIALFGFNFDEPGSRYSPLELALRVKASRYVLRNDRFVVRQRVGESATVAYGSA
jgi:hypothetical protein